MRLVALAGAAAGAAALAQFPEFSQQYLQRLAGRVEALAEVAADFDRSAARAGLTREAALAEMAGTAFLDARQADMRRTFARLDRLSADLEALRAAAPLERLAMPLRMADGELLRATWGDFRPALPVTAEGIAAAGLGGAAGWGLGAILGWLLFRPFRRRAA